MVAALTVPTLIVKYQKEQTVTRLKKAYSALSQTTQRAIADNGPIKSWTIAESSNVQAAHNFTKTYLIPYLSIMKDCGTSNSGDCAHPLLGNTATRFFLSDGTMIGGYWNLGTDYSEVDILIDINGKQKPNERCRDVFYVTYVMNHSITSVIGKFVPYHSSHNISFIKNLYNKGNKYGCMSHIMKSGWTIPDDYPW